MGRGQLTLEGATPPAVWTRKTWLASAPCTFLSSSHATLLAPCGLATLPTLAPAIKSPFLVALQSQTVVSSGLNSWADASPPEIKDGAGGCSCWRKLLEVMVAEFGLADEGRDGCWKTSWLWCDFESHVGELAVEGSSYGCSWNSAIVRGQMSSNTYSRRHRRE